MLTRNVLQSELIEWQAKLGNMGNLPLKFFKGAPKATKLAQHCAMAMGVIEKNRDRRLRILQTMFKLSVCPASTYDLTVAQAYTLRQVAYTGRYSISDDFIHFTESIKNTREIA